MNLELFKHIFYHIVSATVFVTFWFCLLIFIYNIYIFSIEINQNGLIALKAINNVHSNFNPFFNGLFLMFKTYSEKK